MNPKDFFISGTSRSTVVDMAVEAGNLTLINKDYFFIRPETAGLINVIYEDGSTGVISAVAVNAYLGFWIPEKIKTVVKAGTTATFYIGY